MKQNTQKLNAALFKKVDKVVKRNTDNRVGAFDLFFEIVANIILIEVVVPTELFKMLLRPDIDEKELQETIALYNDFYNAIVDAFKQYAQGKSQHHLKNNLYNLVEFDIPESLEDEFLLKHILVSIMRPMMLFLKTHDLARENNMEMKKAIKAKFGLEDALIEDILYVMTINTIAQTKTFPEYDFYMDTREFVFMMIDRVVELSVVFLEIRKEYMLKKGDQPILFESTSFGETSTYNGINFDGVEKNDPCPCGSGKKYKKCCRKAWEYPLTTLTPQKILFKPRMTLEDVGKYYELFNKLMVFVQNDYADKNGKEKLTELFTLKFDGTYAGRDYLIENGEMVNIVEHLNSNRDLITRFIEAKQDELDDKELEVYKEWENFISAECMILQTHNDSEVLAWDMAANKVYLVYGLYDPLASLLPRLPFYADMVLLPFKGRIVFNGLLMGKDIEYGKNILRTLIELYKKDIKENGIVMELTR